MAQDTDSVHAEHGKHVTETNEDHVSPIVKADNADDPEHGPSGLQPEDYDSKTVERVYRKLDLRIIPGAYSPSPDPG